MPQQSKWIQVSKKNVSLDERNSITLSPVTHSDASQSELFPSSRMRKRVDSASLRVFRQGKAALFVEDVSYTKATQSALQGNKIKNVIKDTNLQQESKNYSKNTTEM